MSETKRKVPKLRFPGFTEDWEQRKFSELYEKVTEKNDLSFKLDKVISVASMYYKSDAKVSSEEYLKTYNIFRYGEIAFEGNKSKEYSYGRFVENTIGDGIVSHVFEVFKPIAEYDIKYWKYFINYEPIMGKILSRCTKKTTMMTNLVAADFLKEEILVPKVEEQAKIGEFISKFDNLITLHQRKLENLKLKKKALLQKLFPKNGEQFPELRFPGFTDAWEQRKLGEFGKATGGTSIESDFVEDGEYKVISIGSYSEEALYNDQGLRVNKTEKTKSRILNKNDLTMILNDKTSSGNIIGTVLLIDEDNAYVYNQRTQRIEVNQTNYDAEFLYYMLNSPNCRNLIVKASQGNTQIYVNWSAISNLEYKIPVVLEEQQKIRNLLSNIKSLITLHQRKLEHLQLQKKALLQQMFV